MRIVLFGPPGVGKGSQASLLQERKGMTHISTGIILRNAMQAGTPEGNEAREYVQAGRLVPGVIVRKMAEDAVAECNYASFVLDGYPRTIEQADWLAEFLEMHDAHLHGVMSLKVPDHMIVDRLSKRRVDRVTGENYHLDFKPPPADLPADRIFQRTDDHADVVLKRLRGYQKKTEPVQEYYRERGMLREVDGVGSFEGVHDRIIEELMALLATS